MILPCNMDNSSYQWSCSLKNIGNSLELKKTTPNLILLYTNVKCFAVDSSLWKGPTSWRRSITTTSSIFLPWSFLTEQQKSSQKRKFRSLYSKIFARICLYNVVVDWGGLKSDCIYLENQSKTIFSDLKRWSWKHFLLMKLGSACRQ